jgi:flagellar protein FlgJ
MRVGPQSGPVEKHATAVRQVAPTRTPVSRADLRNAISGALEKVDGARPSSQLVDVLTAHASLETASGDRMYNYNFAGIKGHSPSGTTAVCHTREVLDGKDVVIKDGFRAYGTIDEGALDYVRTMKAQFRGALGPAARGDVDGFASALKSAHYYTASETDYARGLNSLMGAPLGAATQHASVSVGTSAATDLGLSRATLTRVSDALDADRWLAALPTSSFGSSSASSSSAATRARNASEDDDDS